MTVDFTDDIVGNSYNAKLKYIYTIIKIGVIRNGRSYLDSEQIYMYWVICAYI
jgi:hypothetical protein